MNYDYAHFSKINMTNYLLYPNFLFFTHPITFILKEGDSLYIPKKWWHWVITTKKTTAINFWLEPCNSIRDSPFTINSLYSINDRTLLIQKINNKLFNNNVCVWNSNYNEIQCTQEIVGSHFLNMDNDDKYFITLNGYSKSNFDNNKEIKSEIVNEIKTPSYILNNNMEINDINLWISSNFNDTGLHYDDNDGILYVLNGEKQVTLYPPSDSVYLEPYELLPNYALQKPIFMYYNENTIINENVIGKPSELILLKSLEYMAKYKYVFQKIQNLYDGKINNKKLIWGCKKQNDTYRWEIYYYHYESNNINIM
jgi:mannose-6-phosphate isomerase-like protein (cupin superfamily)